MLKRIILPFVMLVAAITPACQILTPISMIATVGVYWIEGEAHKYYNTDQTVIVRALKETLAELKIPIRKESSDDNHIYIKAGDGNDDRFSITVLRVKPEITKLSIRVNIMGDHPFAEMIYRHVDAKQGVKTFQSVEVLNKKVDR